MTLTADQFRSDFTAFGDATVYPDATVAYWLAIAGFMVSSPPWPSTVGAGGRSLQDWGTALFVAHHIVIEGRAARASANGGAPGIASSDGVGLVTSKSVDKTTVAYDGKSTVDVYAAHWNLTTYGTRFRDLVNLLGMGPVQVGCGPAFTPLTLVPQGPAWFGPAIDQGWD